MTNIIHFEKIFEEFPQMQILDSNSCADSLIHNFLKNETCVSTASEAKQQKIRRAVTPFWQERYISMAGEEALYVRDLLLSPKFFLQTEFFIDDEPFPKTEPELLPEALSMAGLSSEILNKKLISLSNGELRRVLLARLWMEKPHVAYFDDPFGGLDPAFRGRLAQTIVALSRTGLKMVVRLRREDELLPGMAAFVCENGILKRYEKALPEHLADSVVQVPQEETYRIENLKTNQPTYGTGKGEILFDLKNVTVRFGETTIIQNLTWQVRAGEHWVVMGPNGAGKSTLLALLSGDHPQIYNNDVTLLGEIPGRGLNIWEHKEKIGFFSPELALHYREKLRLYEVLCTGFSSKLGLFQEPTFAEKQKARLWIQEFGFASPNIYFNELSPIEKRLALIARAAIRPPKVLILDEPTQGLDNVPRERLFDLLQFISQYTTIIFVSHYEDWPSCMNRLLYMPKLTRNP